MIESPVLRDISDAMTKYGLYADDQTTLGRNGIRVGSSTIGGESGITVIRKCLFEEIKQSMIVLTFPEVGGRNDSWEFEEKGKAIKFLLNKLS